MADLLACGLQPQCAAGPVEHGDQRGTVIGTGDQVAFEVTDLGAFSGDLRSVGDRSVVPKRVRVVLVAVVVAVFPATAAQMQTPSDVAVKTAPLIDRLIDALVRDEGHPAMGASGQLDRDRHWRVEQRETTACQVVCVSGSGSGCSDVGVDAVGVDEDELLEGLFPVRGDLAFDEAAGCSALGGWVARVL